MATETSTEIVQFSEAEVREVMALVNKVPRPAQDGGGRMLLDIVNATSIDDIADDASGLPKAELVCDRDLIVSGVTLHDSTMGQQIPYFLVVDAVDAKTGESLRFQTSAGVPFFKLLKLNEADAFPATIRLAKAKKPTQNGFYPINMAITDYRKPSASAKRK